MNDPMLNYIYIEWIMDLGFDPTAAAISISEQAWPDKHGRERRWAKIFRTALNDQPTIPDAGFSKTAEEFFTCPDDSGYYEIWLVSIHETVRDLNGKSIESPKRQYCIYRLREDHTAPESFTSRNNKRFEMLPWPKFWVNALDKAGLLSGETEEAHLTLDMVDERPLKDDPSE